jgi:hypothetical protein
MKGKERKLDLVRIRVKVPTYIRPVCGTRSDQLPLRGVWREIVIYY